MGTAPGFRVLGVPVRIDPSFLLMALFVGWSGNRPPILLVEWVLVVCASVLWHELGHALVYRRFGYQPQIELYAMGGLTSAPLTRPLGAGRDIIVSLAGPAAGLLLGAAVHTGARLAPDTFSGPLASTTVRDLLWVNVAWGVFNLLPMLPLDGGRVMAAVLGVVAGDRGQTAAHAVSVAVAAGAGILAFVARLPFAALIALLFAAMNLRAMRDSRPPPPPGAGEDELAEGERALERGDLGAAAAGARAAHARAGEPAVRERATRLLAWSRLLDGRVDEAAHALASLPPGSRLPALSPAVVRAAGGPEQAVALLRRAADAKPGDETAAELARALRETGRVDDAVDLLSGARARVVDHAGSGGAHSPGVHPPGVVHSPGAHPPGAHPRPADDRLPPAAAAACPRHPGTPAPFRCTNCGRPMCHGCASPGTDAAADGAGDHVAAPACRECRRRSAPRRGPGPAVLGVLAVTVAAFLAQQADPSLLSRFGGVPALVARGEWYRLLTPMLLHADLVHLAFNSYALWGFGPTVERSFGPVRFVALYIVSGFAGEVASVVFGHLDTIGVGSSGAVFGLLGAHVVLVYRQRRENPVGLRQILLVVGFALVIGLAVPRVDVMAHVGGVVAGVVVAAGFVASRPRGRRRALAHGAVVAVVVATGIALVIARLSPLAS